MDYEPGERIYELITRDLQEVLGDKTEMMKLCAARPFRIYWGTAPTGRIHLGYLVPLMKIVDFLNANCGVTILFADLHAFLDSKKTTLELLEARTEYYERMIKTVLQTLGADLTRLRFIRGTRYQLSDKYMMDVYKMASQTTLAEARHAGAEVVKQSDNPLMTGLMYPLLQSLDEEYLEVDAQFGGVDQRKIFAFSRSALPKLKYKKRFHLMTPMASGLSSVKREETVKLETSEKTELLKQEIRKLVESENDHDKLLEQLDILIKKEQEDDSIQENKMSSSNENGKIDLLDGKGQLKKKINSAYCLPGNIEDNTPLELIRMIIFPLLLRRGRSFEISRKEEFGGDIFYVDYKSLEEDFKNEKLHPGDLKSGMIDILNEILTPIRDAFADRDSQKLIQRAYPAK